MCLYVIRLGQRFTPVSTPGNRTELEACLGAKLRCGLGKWPENLAKSQFNQSGQILIHLFVNPPITPCLLVRLFKRQTMLAFCWILGEALVTPYCHSRVVSVVGTLELREAA